MRRNLGNVQDRAQLLKRATQTMRAGDRFKRPGGKPRESVFGNWESVLNALDKIGRPLNVFLRPLFASRLITINEITPRQGQGHSLIDMTDDLFHPTAHNLGIAAGRKA